MTQRSYKYKEKILLISLIILISIIIVLYFSIRQDNKETIEYSTKQDLSSWTEYKNPEYGFSFKYPPELTMSENWAPGQWQVNVFEANAYGNPEKDIFSMWVETYEATLEDLYGHHSERERGVYTTFRGDRAVLVVDCGASIPCVLPATDEEVIKNPSKIIIDHDGRMYTVVIPSQRWEWDTSDTELFNTIFSTLEFGK